MIVNIKTKYHEGKIEAPEWLLGVIAFYVSKGANHLALVGCNVHAKEAREISQQILDALRREENKKWNFQISAE